jgi:opacity protein-like surface antigen
MKKIILILLLTIAISVQVITVSAQQGELRMTASLAGAVPTGGLKDMVDKTSLRGADITILYGVNDKLGVGLDLGFQDFYQKFPRAVYKLSDGSDISAVITNSIQTIPFLATAKYNFTPGNTIQLYATAGAGGAVVINRQFIGESPNDDNKISFAAKPGIGVYIPFRKQGEVGLNLGASYNYIAYKQEGVSNLSYIGFTVGIGFPMRN